MRLILVIVMVLIPTYCFGQSAPTGESAHIRGSATYSEILFRKTELQADLESYSADYTDANPKLLDLRFELAALSRLTDRIFKVKPSETERLTLALGKLIVRKAALETDLSRLSRNYNKDHPEVKRAKRRIEIFESAINEVLR